MASETAALTIPQDDVRVFKAKPVSFACSCSRERVENALRIAGATEIESILAERDDVEVTCEFCNRRYAFAPAEARALFVPDTAGLRRAHAAGFDRVVVRSALAEQAKDLVAELVG